MKVVWARPALSELQDIYQYYLENVSFQMAENIRKSVLTATRQLGKNPLSGIPEQKLSVGDKEYRSVVRGHYKIIYRLGNREVNVVDVFDTRQNPRKNVRYTKD